MTMVLTCLTKDFTVQASDRRFTYPSGAKEPNDASNKALIYKNHFAFAFTGLAELSSQLPSLSTIVWAGEQLKEKDTLEASVKHLCAQATEKLKTLPKDPFHDNLKFLDFIGAGFLGVEKNNPLDRRPARVVISNWMEKNRTWPSTVSKPHSYFTQYYDFLSKGKLFNLFVAGQRLNPRRKEVLSRKITDCLKKKDGPQSIGRLLTEAIQATAKENPTVGGNIMCTFVPRATNPNSRMMHIGGVLLNPPTNSDGPQTLTVSKDHDCFLPFPDFDLPRIIYVSENGTPFPSFTPINVFPGHSVSPIEVGEMTLNFTPVRGKD